jgi:hypothetical protein
VDRLDDEIEDNEKDTDKSKQRVKDRERWGRAREIAMIMVDILRPTSLEKVVQDEDMLKEKHGMQPEQITALKDIPAMKPEYKRELEKSPTFGVLLAPSKIGSSAVDF